jgi:hypothetical protein
MRFAAAPLAATTAGMLMWAAVVVFAVVAALTVVVRRPRTRVAHEAVLRRSRRPLAVALSVVVLGGLLSACGHGSASGANNSGSATESRPTSTADPAPVSPRRKKQIAAVTRLMRCLRRNGADVPMPEPGTSRIPGGMAVVAAALTTPQGRRAFNACGRYVLAARQALNGP